MEVGLKCPIRLCQRGRLRGEVDGRGDAGDDLAAAMSGGEGIELGGNRSDLWSNLHGSGVAM